MQEYLINEIFDIPTFEKPRALRQTWLKDVGFDEAPVYSERMGLVELADFLEVSAPRLDFVKIVTSQILYSPEHWLKRKIETYQRFGIEPYLDHSFFISAYKQGIVDKAISAGRGLGFRVIEFMNTGNDVSPQQWKTWRNLALENDMRIVFEYHPSRNWDPDQPDHPITAEGILATASPFLDDGAFAVMLDHDLFEPHNNATIDAIASVVDELGLERLVFEATSPKEGPMIWHKNLMTYFGVFGPDCNVANIMPSQAMYVESMRTG